MKTNELTGVALDWAVTKAEGLDCEVTGANWGCRGWATDWAQGGAIIEREKITLEWTGENWMGYIWHDKEFFGSTPLIAAMRCYVASKLGDEVEPPDALKMKRYRGTVIFKYYQEIEVEADSQEQAMGMISNLMDVNKAQEDGGDIYEIEVMTKGEEK